jgi:hypothetical protein
MGPRNFEDLNNSTVVFPGAKVMRTFSGNAPVDLDFPKGVLFKHDAPF